MPKKSGMQLFSAFLSNLYVGACLHNEKYAGILCSSVLKRFSAGLHKDTVVRRELARMHAALGSAVGRHREGEGGGEASFFFCEHQMHLNIPRAFTCLLLLKHLCKHLKNILDLVLSFKCLMHPRLSRTVQHILRRTLYSYRSTGTAVSKCLSSLDFSFRKWL